MKAEYIIKIDGEPDIMGNYPLKDKPQELVRCKDCKNIKKLPIDNHGHQPYWCENLNIYSEGLDWFCADGERRTDDA